MGGPDTGVMPPGGGAAEGGRDPDGPGGAPGGAAEGARVGGPAGGPPGGRFAEEKARGIVLNAVGGVPAGGPDDPEGPAGVAVLERGGGGGAAGAASGFC